MKLSNYIEIRSDKRFGKPVLKGTRISVSDVLNWLANGMTKEEIVHDFPEVTFDAIKACLLYASSKENRIGIAS